MGGIKEVPGAKEEGERSREDSWRRWRWNWDEKRGGRTLQVEESTGKGTEVRNQSLSFSVCYWINHYNM